MREKNTHKHTELDTQTQKDRHRGREIHSQAHGHNGRERKPNANTQSLTYKLKKINKETSKQTVTQTGMMKER